MRQCFIWQEYFNPRSREGSDFIRISALHLFSISIHAPAKGATLLPDKALPHLPISIHAPAKGATPYIDDIVFKYEFQSTLPRRERQLLPK